MSAQTATGSSRSARAGRELALTIGAVAGLICVLAAAASMLFGIKPLVFRSGSMSPEITTGSLALARTVPATDLAVGDVVSVVNSQGTRITHRVYDLEPQAGNSVTVTLKGDANAQPDAEPYFIAEADRIFFSIGGLGYAVEWLSSPLAIFLGGAMVGGLVMVAFRPASRRDDSDEGPSGGIGSSEADSVDTTEIPIVSARGGRGGLRAPLSLRKLTILGVAALSIFGATHVSGTAAAFTSSATANSDPLSVNSNILPPPETMGCRNVGNYLFRSANFYWKHLGAPFAYLVLITRTDGSGGTWTNNFTPTAAKDAEISFNVGEWILGRISYGQFKVEFYTVNSVSGQRSLMVSGGKAKSDTYQDYTCDGGLFVKQAGTVLSSSMARTAPSAENTSTAATSTTSPAETTTTSPAATTAPTTTETSNGTTVESSTATTAATTTVTTTPEATTTTTIQAPVVLDGPETSPTGYAATVAQTDAGAAVVVTNSSGATFSSTPVSATAKIKWQSDSDALWIVDGTDVYRVSATAGVAEKNPSTIPPVDIAAWIDGLK